MQKVINSIIAVLAFLHLSSVYALVDYSRPSSKPRQVSTKIKSQGRSFKKSTSRKKSSQSSIKPLAKSSIGIFGFSGVIGSQSVKTDTVDDSVAIHMFSGQFQTNFDLYIDASYWLASSNNYDLANTSTMQDGNFEGKIGFNWFKFGNIANLAAINFYAGASLANTTSDFATSRFDKIVGVVASKRFYNFAFALGYEFRITGAPSNTDEMGIGNISIVTAALGWVVSSDIAFRLEGTLHNIKKGTKDNGPSFLTEEVAFGNISPRLILGLHPYIDLELGAKFQTKKFMDNEKLLKAKLWNLQGSYGDVLFASLSVKI